MTGRSHEPPSAVWTRSDDSGAMDHRPPSMNWGPQAACPVSVWVAPPSGWEVRSQWADPRRGDPRGRWHVSVVLLGDCQGEVVLNPGAARWLGNRLIEAAALAETRPAPVAAASAAAFGEQDGAEGPQP